MTRSTERPAWATDTRTIDGWQDAAYRREVSTVASEGGVVVALEQGLEQGASPLIRLEVDGICAAGFHESATIRALERALRNAREALEEIVGRDAGECQVKCRPGVLDALAAAMGIDDDAALAGALGLKRHQVERLRAGGRFAGDELSILADKIHEVGLRTSWARAARWLTIAAE